MTFLNKNAFVIPLVMVRRMECFQLIILVDSPVPTTEHKEFDFGSISIKYRIFLFWERKRSLIFFYVELVKIHSNDGTYGCMCI